MVVGTGGESQDPVGVRSPPTSEVESGRGLTGPFGESGAFGGRSVLWIRLGEIQNLPGNEPIGVPEDDDKANTSRKDWRGPSHWKTRERDEDGVEGIVVLTEYSSVPGRWGGL